MQKNSESRAKTKSEKRRRIILSETDSSDECDSPMVKARRKQRMNKLTRDIKRLTKDADNESEAACSSQNGNSNGNSRVHVRIVQCDKEIEKRREGKNSSDDSGTEFRSNDEKLNTSEALKPPEKVLEDIETAERKKTDAKVEKNVDASEEECPICWAPLVNQEVAIPSSCKHCFCLQCIIEWSKNTNTCPVDRQSFNKIEVRQNFGGKQTTRFIPIETRHQVDPDGLENSWTNASDSDHIEFNNPAFEYDSTDHNSNSRSSSISEMDVLSYSSHSPMEGLTNLGAFDSDDKDDDESRTSSIFYDREDEQRHSSSSYNDEVETGNLFSSPVPSPEMDSSYSVESPVSLDERNDDVSNADRNAEYFSSSSANSSNISVVSFEESNSLLSYGTSASSASEAPLTDSQGISGWYDDDSSTSTENHFF